MGRLNVARSPDHVLDRALDEAKANFTADMVTFYNLPLDQMISELTFHFDDQSFIDSPLQNLGLFQDALDGSSVLSTVGVTKENYELLSVFLGTASDKTVEITPDTAYAVSVILDDPLTSAEATAIAADAEAIRIAILAGHG